MEALLVEIKGCCSTGAESKAGSRNTEQSICDVDLNKSYPYKWNKKYNICIRFPGISKECELEVKSYTDYLVKNKIQGFVTLHSYEGFILYPWGYQKKLYTDDREKFHKLGEKMKNDVGQNADILYGANGCFNDYAKCLENKYVFTIKMGSRKMYNFGFMISKSYISNNGLSSKFFSVFNNFQDTRNLYNLMRAKKIKDHISRLSQDWKTFKHKACFKSQWKSSAMNFMFLRHY
uniref:Peptidase M14 domain-containing protein n=1 Tax=Strongyloides stercoralis TaxID=6248 RepID=A0AAF5D8F0_STRER